MGAVILPGVPGGAGRIAKALGPAEKLAAKAAQRYPKMAKLGDQWHHIVPKYLGGMEKGLRIKIPAAYHGAITAAFREKWPYGGRKPRPDELRNIMCEVYGKLPLPNRPMR